MKLKMHGFSYRNCDIASYLVLLLGIFNVHYYTAHCVFVNDNEDHNGIFI